MKEKVLVFIEIIVTIFVVNITANPDPNFHLYLLFGQSNMEGGCNQTSSPQEALDIQKEDCEVSDRIRVLAFKTCQNQVSGPCRNLKLNREQDKWYPAFPPFHNCGAGIGPADYFSKVLVDSIQKNISLGLIPCALSGQSIDVFVKGSGKKPDNWTHGAIPGHAYDWMVSRGRLAQKSGVIKGILFHQGETDNGNSSWVDKAKSVFDNLKKDLNLPDNIPIVVGELLQDNGACCTLHNPLVKKLASEYPNCGLASSKGLKMRPSDQWNAHFDCAGMRELGRRFAFEFLKLADTRYIPRKGDATLTVPHRAVSLSAGIEHSWMNSLQIYDVNGKFIMNLNSLAGMHSLRDKLRGRVYIVSNKITGTQKLLVLP